MAAKRKSRAEEGPPDAIGARKQPRRESSQRPSQEQQQPARKKLTPKELRQVMEKYIYNPECASECTLCATGMWQRLLMSTADDGGSALQMALDLVEGPWELTPIRIVHRFKGFACDDIKWIIRHLWQLCFRTSGANELSWTEVLAVLKISAQKNKTTPGTWSREAFIDAQSQGIDEAVDKKKKSAAKKAKRTSADHIEQIKPRSSGHDTAVLSLSSAQRLGGTRGTIESPPFPESPAKPPSASAVSPTARPRGIIDNGKSPLPTTLPGNTAPLGRRDGSVMLLDRETTPPSIYTGETRVPRRRVLSARIEHSDDLRSESYQSALSETNQSSSGDSTAPIELEADARLRAAAILEEFESRDPISTATLRYMLAKLGLAQSKVDLGGVRVLDLGDLIQSSVGQVAGLASGKLHPVSARDIETWTPSDLDCDGIKTFVLPFTGQPEVPSAFYVLKDSICHAYLTTPAQENIMLTQTLPEKLIRAVAGLEGAKNWKMKLLKIQDCYDRSHKDHPREEDCGLQALAVCLACLDNLFFLFKMDISFWRAVLATAIHESAGTRFFNDWLQGKWSSQQFESTPVRDKNHHPYYAGAVKAREARSKAERRQSRLARVLKDDIGELRAWIRYAQQKFIDVKKTMAAQREEIRIKTGPDFQELKEKTEWNAKRYLGADAFKQLGPEQVYGPYLSRMKLLYEQRSKKEQVLLQVQEHAAEDALKFHDQLLAALEAGEGFAQRMKIEAEDDVQKAKDFLQSELHVAKAKFEKDKARRAEEKRRIAEQQQRLAEEQARLELEEKRAEDEFEEELVDID